MQQIKKTADYTIFQKTSGRYAVKGRKSKKMINGDEKLKILVDEQLVKLPDPKAAPVEPEVESTGEEAATA